MWRMPAATDEDADPAKPETATGTRDGDVEPSPSCPWLLAPQHIREPFPESRAQVWYWPKAREDTPVRPGGPDTGTFSGVVLLPFPHCPNALAPQHMMLPSLDITAHVDRLAVPETMNATPLKPVTFVAVTALEVPPFPSWPSLFRPQQGAATPPFSSEHTCA